MGNAASNPENGDLVVAPPPATPTYIPAIYCHETLASALLHGNWHWREFRHCVGTGQVQYAAASCPAVVRVESLTRPGRSTTRHCFGAESGGAAVAPGGEYPAASLECYDTYMKAAARAKELADMHIPGDDDDDFE